MKFTPGSAPGGLEQVFNWRQQIFICYITSQILKKEGREIFPCSPE
jgi:hypothetical protein